MSSINAAGPSDPATHNTLLTTVGTGANASAGNSSSVARNNMNGRHNNIFAKNKTKKLVIDRKFMASHDFAVNGGFQACVTTFAPM